ncbi:MAG: preprotein translocase subunit YajC [Lachnospiraceae bacterium]|jgi:preprotein translocase subunit YajC|nr:preprotein translocase subunit YajC [Lachnospiraceae bacterium]MBR4808083.1 preprotein translocase subunit YajC [Lachnospiraceae bacterium]
MPQGVSTIIMMVGLIAIMYFMMIRPQQKEQKRKNAMLAEMAVGDTVLTTSGFYGILIDVSEDTVIVEFGNNKNCRIPMQKACIAEVEKAGTPATTSES